jgi:hypothetical protein
VTAIAPTEQQPTLAQLLLRRMGREMYEEGRPKSACLSRDEQIGWQQASDEAKQGQQRRDTDD